MKKVYRRQYRASNWREFGSWITTKDWSEVYQATSCISKFESLSFSQELSSAIETFFPWKTVKTYAYDKPWITAKLKSMIKKRQAAFINYGKHLLVFRMWRNRVQGAIKTAKRSYYDSKVDGLAESNPKKWWQDIKSLSGQDIFSKQEWHHQLLNDTINSPGLLAAQINYFFTSITHEFEPLTQVQTPPNVISSDLLVSLEEVSSDLLKLPTQKAVGPDGISNKLLKEFAPELAPLIQDIYNQSLREGFVPDTLKQSIITPVPKVCPPQDIKSDLRPIGLTSCLAKVLEGFTNKRLLRQMSDTIDPRQYARHGHSTVHALIYLMQAIHEAIDSGNYSVRIFFADFTKGFDIIDHSVLLDELKSFDIDQTLFFWVRSFLTNRVQAVRVGSSLSSWKQVNGGVPQGTKLGPTLFAVMINKLLRNWHMRSKYVDDTTAIEIIPRNSIRILDLVVREIHDYCIEHKMKLNPKKCKEMYINFMTNSVTSLRPICVGYKEVERVGTYKLLGVIISDDLKWNAHVEYVIAKAAKRLFALRLLKRAGVMPKDILKVYLCNVRSVLEYAAQVWQDIPAYLSDAIESIQRRALRIIFPNSSYQQALDLTNLSTLANRRILLCKKLMADMRDESHPISFLAPKVTTRNIPYQLRSGNTTAPKTMKRTKRANDFFTFRFA